MLKKLACPWIFWSTSAAPEKKLIFNHISFELIASNKKTFKSMACMHQKWKEEKVVSDNKKLRVDNEQKK